jgi:hypothetical protein
MDIRPDCDKDGCHANDTSRVQGDGIAKTARVNNASCTRTQHVAINWGTANRAQSAKWMADRYPAFGERERNRMNKRAPARSE